MLTIKCLFALLIITSLSISGCVSQISVKPEELISTQIYKTQPAPAKPIEIAVTDFSLKTGKPANEIGEAKTGGFNMPTPIKTEQPANIIVSKAIQRGLSGMGHQIVEPRNAEYNLDGAVEKLWVEEYATGVSFEYAKAHVIYDVILRGKSGNILWATTIQSFKVSGKSIEATSDDLPTLKAALTESISKLLEDPSFWHALSN